VLDLDETLVHSTFQPSPKVDIQVPVQIDDKITHVYVAVRPGVQQFLIEMEKI
jgi:RNA polymerase II subunit A small phosphatase-like protein